MAFQKLRRKIYAGVVLDIEVYAANRGVRNAIDIERKLRKPRTEEEKKIANEKQSQKRFIGNMNQTFATGGLYVTLTYDDKHLPSSYSEAESVLKRFVRKLRYKFPNVKIMAVTGYGRQSGRLHHHLVILGAWESYIIEKWKEGSVTRIEALRAHNVYNGVDRGRDYTALATYLFNHAVESGRGKRWIQTKNVSQPEREEAQEIKRNYSVSKPPKTPNGYMLVDIYEGVNGFFNFKYVKIPTYKNRTSSRGIQSDEICMP